jgi:hypothetical protein
MTSEKKIFWAVVLAAAAAVGVLWLWPRVGERVAPRPVAAWVAVEVDGAGVARVGPVEVPAGTPFTLHAVLEAETRRGEAVFYTEAPGLELPGGAVPAERLRRWRGPLQAKVLWFTVEGPNPYLELAAGEGLERLQFAEYLRSDWPFNWSVRGRVEPASDDHLSAPGADDETPFGTQRYQARIELYAEEGQMVPQARFASWGKEAVRERRDRFPTVTATLPGPAATASAAFGLTQIEAVAPDPALRRTLVDLTRQRLAFSRVPLLAEVIAAAGRRAEDLGWRSITLDGGQVWGEEVHAGDLLRAGDRWVVLYRDAAPPPALAEGETPPPAGAAGPGDGRLDGDDLALDFVRGAAVRRLSQIFDLTGGGAVGWAPLGG